MLKLRAAIASFNKTQKSLRIALFCGIAALSIAPVILYLQHEIENSLKKIERSQSASINLERALSSFLSMELAARGYASFYLLEGSNKQDYLRSFRTESQQFEFHLAYLKGYLPDSTLAEMDRLKTSKELTLNRFINSFATNQK